MADPRYKKGKIYRILCDDGHYYIGSTFNELKCRFRQHKEAAKISTSRVYTYINSIGWDKAHMNLIEDWPCGSKACLLEREAFYINELKDDELCLNINRSAVTNDERSQIRKTYYETHREEIIKKTKEYVEKNKEKADQYQAEYREKNAEKRRAYTKQYTEEHPEWKKTYDKQYYESNKEEIMKKTKEYVEKNKEKIRQRKKQWTQKKKEENKEQIEIERQEKKIEKEKKKQENKERMEAITKCECGGTYQPYRKSRHDKSKKHMDYIEQV